MLFSLLLASDLYAKMQTTYFKGLVTKPVVKNDKLYLLRHLLYITMTVSIMNLGTKYY